MPASSGYRLGHVRRKHAPGADIPASLACLVLAALSLAAPSALAAERPGEPIVLTGSDLGELRGLAPDRVVAYAHRGRRGWDRIPVQVDERVTVDFGINPPNNTTAGVPGTVYGTQATGATASQYADPDTFVGADPDPDVDAGDEVVFMAADAGERAPRRAGTPGGVKASRGERVELSDPLGGGKSFVYLYSSRGRARSAGEDYVSYDFELASGDYKTTYRRADGPNPESSRIRTDSYEAGFSDRWMFDDLRIRAGKASGAEILDGFKFSFAPGNCGRSEATFNDSEGAFVANVDGPVRAIRSYVGANSGPLTERTHYFYDSRHDITTDLRVHPVGGSLIYHDLNEAGIGMTFRNSENPGGVPVDGAADAIATGVAEWRMWSGGQGSLFAADRLESTFAESFMAQASEFYADDSTPDVQQCWGDALAIGQAGFRSTASLPNTDPRTSPTDHLRTTTTEILSEPNAGANEADRWSRELDAPLRVRVR